MEGRALCKTFEQTARPATGPGGPTGVASRVRERQNFVGTHTPPYLPGPGFPAGLQKKLVLVSPWWPARTMFFDAPGEG